MVLGPPFFAEVHRAEKCQSQQHFIARPRRRRRGPGAAKLSERDNQDDLNTAVLSDLLGVAPFVVDEEIDKYGVGFVDGVATMDSWLTSTAQFHGGEFTEDDWLALVLELARRAAGLSQGIAMNDGNLQKKAVRECIELLTEGERQRARTGRADIGFTVEHLSKIKATLQAVEIALRDALS